jgi:hypothetical protein
MSAPPGTPYEYWAIGQGATFSDGSATGDWTGQVLGKVLSQILGGGICSYSAAQKMVHLTGGAAFETGASVTLTQPYTLVMLVNNDSGTNFPYNLWSTTSLSVQLAAGNSTLTATSDNSNFVSWTANTSTGTTYSFMVVFNGSSSKAYLNGSALSVSSGTTVGTTNFSNNALQVNGYSGGNGYALYQGSVIVYNNDASSNAAAIDTWLRAQPAAGGAANAMMISGILPM